VIFTHAGNIGSVAYIPESSKYKRYVLSQRQFYMRCDKERLLPEYITYFFKTELGKKKLLANSSSVGVPSIAQPVTYLKGIEIAIPRLEQQKKIVKILSSLDDKIELNLRMNKTLESIAQAIFKEWFVYFRFPGFDGELVDGLPKGWRKSNLNEAVNVKGGSTPSTKNSNFWGGNNFWATPRDLSSLQSPVLLTTERRITDNGVKQISSGVLPSGTLLLSSRAPVGYLAISQVPVSINQGFIAIQGKLVSNLFMLFWLDLNIEKIKGWANGSTFQEISKSTFKEIGITIPNGEVLKWFDKIITPFLDRIVSNEKENRILTQIRDTLLPKLMSGKIRVP